MYKTDTKLKENRLRSITFAIEKITINIQGAIAKSPI